MSEQLNQFYSVENQDPQVINGEVSLSNPYQPELQQQFSDPELDLLSTLSSSLQRQIGIKMEDFNLVPQNRTIALKMNMMTMMILRKKRTTRMDMRTRMSVSNFVTATRKSINILSLLKFTNDFRFFTNSPKASLLWVVSPEALLGNFSPAT